MATLSMRQGSKFVCSWNCYNPDPLTGEPDLTSPYDLSSPGWVAQFSFQVVGGAPWIFRSDDAEPVVVIDPEDDARIGVEISAAATGGYDFTKAKYETELIPPSGEEDKITLDWGTIELEKQIADA